MPYTKKDKTQKKGFYFGCLGCRGEYIHQDRMVKNDSGIIVCPKCGHHQFIMRRKE